MGRINFDLQELQAFVAVAERASFRAAAEDLHLSQPALSRRVDKLEAQLGAKLLERTTRRVSLTNIGRVFLERARTAIDELESAVLSIGDLATQREGLITVACVPSVAYYFLPTIIHEYSLRFPASACASLTKRPTRCSTASYRAVPISASAFSAPRNPTWTSRPCCAKTSCLPFATTTRCRAAAASPGMNWRASAMTVAKESGNRLLIDDALAKSGKRTVSAYEVSHVMTLLGLVEAGLGVAAVPRLAMPLKGHSTLASVLLEQPRVTRSLGLISRRGRPLAPAAQQLYNLIDQTGKSAKRKPSPRPSSP